MDAKVYLHYRDDGPNGPCGQAMSTTMPWSRLLIYEGPDAERDATTYARHLDAHNVGRLNARIEEWWLEIDGHVRPGPILHTGQEGS